MHDVHEVSLEEAGVPGVQHGHAAQHLTHDDLDVLGVDVHALGAVDLLDLLDEVALGGGHRTQAQDLLGVDRSLGEGLAGLDVVPVVHQQALTARDRDDDVLLAVVAGDDQALAVGVVLDLEGAGGLGHGGLTLGRAGLEELLHTGQTLGDVSGAGRTTGVEGTHGQLRTGLTDGLGGDDADGLTDVHALTGGQRAAVAGGAGADVGVAGEHGAHRDLLDARVDGGLNLGVTQVSAGLDDEVALGVDGVARQGGAEYGGAEDLRGLLDALVAGVDPGEDPLGQALAGAAVLLADDDVLGDVDQTAREVAGVGGTQRRVRQALTGAVGGDEVLQDAQALTVVRLDRALDEALLGVGHQSTHTGELADLVPVASGPGDHHLVDGVALREVLAHRLGDLGGGLGPDVDEGGVAVVLGEGTELELLLDLSGLVLVANEDLLLGLRGDDVGEGDGDTGPGGPVEAVGLEGVQGGGHLDARVVLRQGVDDVAQLLLVNDVVDVGEGLGQRGVEQGPAQRGAQGDRVALAPALGRLPALGSGDALLEADVAGGVDVELAEVVGHDRLREGGECRDDLVALGVALDLDRRVGVGGEVVGADDHVLTGHGHGAPVGGLEDVVRGQHEDAGLSLRLGAQREVDGHLVAVEVGVEGAAHERVQLDGLALDELGLEGLDAQAVQGGGAVEQHGVLADDLGQDVPDLGVGTLDHALGGLDVLGLLELDEPLHDEGLEQLQGHLAGQTALVELELGADDDDATAGVVHALAQEVLAEAALLALEHVGQGLQRTVAHAGDRTAAAAVVEQGVDGVLKHALLVVDDDRRGAQVHEPLEAVVAVDDAAVEVVEVTRGEAATVELDHGAQVRRDDRDVVQDHRLRGGAGHAEGVDDLEALDGTGLALAGAVLDDLGQGGGLGLEVEAAQAGLDGLGTHGALEVDAVVGDHVAVEDLVTLQVTDLEAHEAVPHLVHVLQGALVAAAHGRDLALGGLAELVALGGLGALGLELGEVLLEALLARLDLGLAGLLEVLLLDLQLVAQRGQVVVAALLIHLGDHVGREVDDLLQVLGREVEQVAQARGHALEVPDVGDRRGELDVGHALATHLGASDLDSAALADDPLVAHALVLAAGALPVPGGAEDLLAEEAVLLGLEGAVVDGLGLLDLAVGPRANVLRGGEAELDPVEHVGVEHSSYFRW